MKLKKVISDLNIDKNGNQIAGTYDWNTNYVYVPSTYINKINTPKGKNNIDTITNYQDSDYTYDLYIYKDI